MTRNKRKSYQATIDGERGDNLEKTPRKSAILKAELRAKKKEEARRAAAKKTTPSIGYDEEGQPWAVEDSNTTWNVDEKH